MLDQLFTGVSHCYLQIKKLRTPSDLIVLSLLDTSLSESAQHFNCFIYISCECVPHVCVCPQRTEEGTRSSGVIGSCEPDNSGYSRRAVSALYDSIISRAPNTTFHTLLLAYIFFQIHNFSLVTFISHSRERDGREPRRNGFLLPSGGKS